MVSYSFFNFIFLFFQFFLFSFLHFKMEVIVLLIIVILQLVVFNESQCISNACVNSTCVDNQICLKESISCEDYNPSTIDSCDKKRGCLHTYCYSTSSHQYFNPELENSYSHYSFSFYGRKRSIGRTTPNGK